MSGQNKSEGVNSLVMLATKSDLKEFREDPTAVPLCAVVQGSNFGF